MKREYVKPEVEKISFCYRDQVVAASGDPTGGANGGGSGGWGDWLPDGVKCAIGNLPDQWSEAMLGGCVTYTDEN